MQRKGQLAAHRKPKVTYSLDTPYTDVQWPVLSAEDQTQILDMLCSLLSPIGEHRLRNVAPSKGKRAKKRRRRDDSGIKDQLEALPEEAPSETGAPAWPEMHNHLTVGLNTTTRYLESLAQRSCLSTDGKLHPVMADKPSAGHSLNPADIKPLAAVFVTRTGQPPILHSHLPLLTKTVSLAIPSPSIRIIPLPEGAEDQLKVVLGIPRVGIVGLVDGAPNASSLIEFIRSNVPEFDVPWLHEAVKGVYLAVKIKGTQSGVPFNPK